jgi:hypothetical protein
MDFNKSPEGRFKYLAGEPNNLFGSSRQPRNSPNDDNTNYRSTTIGSYVPPSKRNNNKRDNGRRRTEGMILPDANHQRKAPTTPPDIKDQERFPSLISVSKTSNKSTLGNALQEKPQVVLDTESEENNYCCDISVSDLDTPNYNLVKKPSFASITMNKEEAPSTPPEREPLKPGWVRLFRDPNGEFMKEYGPPVPENPYFKQVREYQQRRVRQQLIDTLERNIAYTREMDSYYDCYNPDQDDYEDDDDDDEEGLSDNEYTEEYESEDYSEDDYY